MIEKETVILRSQNSSNDILSSFGAKINETRLTSYFGYLLSLNIGELNIYLGINSPIQGIKIEKTLETQRCDIIVQTIKKHLIIEAKVNNVDPIPQLLKQAREYKKEFSGKIELISLTRSKRSLNFKGYKSITWDNIYRCLREVKYKSKKQKILSEEFMKHLVNSGLVLENHKEVYARDVNKEPYLSLFLKGHIYICKYNDKIYKCNYFAPYFGNQISTISPGVKEGMSYVAKIYNYLEIKSISELEKAIVTHIRTKKLSHSFPEYKTILKNAMIDRNESHTLLLLNKPHLLFNPPIDKKSLVRGTGYLNKNYYEFEELFESAGI